MAKKKFNPPTKQEMIDFARLRNLNVDADTMYQRWEDGEWCNIKGRAVLPHWKLHLWTHHQINEAKDISYRCHVCTKSPAPYIEGRDRDGHPYHFCHDHKPRPKPVPEQIQKMTEGIGDIPKDKTLNFHDERNKQRKALGL